MTAGRVADAACSIDDMAELSGRVALVTGGSRGIGRASAVALARAGCDVAVNYLRAADEAAAVAREIEALGRRAVAVQADVSQQDDVTRLVEECARRLGPVDVLVNNAGINPGKPLEELTLADWRETLDVNLTSAFLVSQAVLPGMRERRFGRLIFLSSVAAQTGGVIGPHYAASKAGMLGLMHSYANLLVKEGITSNAITPALIETDMIRNNPRIKPEILPVGRFGTAEETAEVVVMLAGNGFMTGQTIGVNGGWYMT
ncbi:MAG TPA: 3-oxoacyl-ACP reductase family protein [Acidobacteriaceae bacterium]|nr:3-oxoacyl-ACP reductase family protein [Acidobacteriaceae bacterium]